MKWKYDTLNDRFLLNENVNYHQWTQKTKCIPKVKMRTVNSHFVLGPPNENSKGAPRGDARQKLKQCMCFWVEVSEKENGPSVNGPRE